VDRIPVVFVAALSAMICVGAAGKWAGRTRRASVAAAETAVRVPATEPPRGWGEPGLVGLGSGPPPPGVPADRGARMLHGNPRHVARASGVAPRTTPAVVWSRDVGGPVEAQVSTSADEATLYVASLGGALTALAASDGTVRWSLGLGDRVYGAPCIADDGTLFVGSDAKRFVAVSPGGSVKWSLDTEGEADTAAAIAPDGSVVFAAGRRVYGVTQDGRVKWRFAARRKVFTAPAIDPTGRVFFGSQDHRAYALSADGTLVWSVDLEADVDGGPAIADDGAVFMGTDGGEVVRLDAGDGHVAWRTTVGGYVRGTLSIARNGDVLAGVYGPTPRAVRVRAGDGTLAGAFSIQGTGARDFGVHGAPLEDDRATLLLGTQDDDVYAIGPSGSVLWRFTTGGDVDAPITLLTDGTVIVASDDGVVRALRAPP
jgi:outer membrane protein assembly factor BamB